MKTQTKKGYARPTEAAKHFGVCKTTLWRWLQQADFPQSSKIGRKITLFHIAEVALWIKTHKEAK